jgi:hypothetical protein
LPTISAQLAARLCGDYREEICQQLWGQIPEPLRLERFDAASTGGHPGFSFRRTFQHLDLRPLPEPMRREVAWCLWRVIDQGGQIHGAYVPLVHRLSNIDADDRATNRPPTESLMDRPLEEWERSMAKATLRRGLALSGMKPARWALRACYRLLHLAYDPREWWEHEVWDLRLDARIPVRAHEPTAKNMINFLAIEQDWLRAGLRWHGKVGLETGMSRWSTVYDRVTGLKHFSAFLTAAGVDHPALAERPTELRLLALDFLGYLRGLRAVTGPNRGGRLSDSYLVHLMGDVEQFYAFMADHHHEAASRLGDHRWRYFGAVWLAWILALAGQVAINDGNYYEAINGGQNLLGGWRRWKRIYTCLILACAGGFAAWLVPYHVTDGFEKLGAIQAITLPSATIIMAVDHFLLPRLFKVSRSMTTVPSWEQSGIINGPGVFALVVAILFGAYTQGIIGSTTTNWYFAIGETWVLAALLYLLGVAITVRLIPNVKVALGFSVPATEADVVPGDIVDLASVSAAT